MKIYEIEKEYCVDANGVIVDIFYTIKKGGRVICNKVDLNEFLIFFKVIENDEKGELAKRGKEKEKMKELESILANYEKEDCEIFKKTVEELSNKGIAKGCFQNYSVLSDVISILYACCDFIKNED